MDGEPLPQEDLEIIRQYSSGISNVHAEQRVCRNWFGEEDTQTVVVFDLDADAIRDAVWLSKKHIPTEQVGRYIFVMPHCGEFYCVLGEIRDGQMIPLHEDDFYMK